MTDKTPLVGLSGTLGSWSFGLVNDLVGIVCGLVTLTYLLYKFYKELKA